MTTMHGTSIKRRLILGQEQEKLAINSKLNFSSCWGSRSYSYRAREMRVSDRLIRDKIGLVFWEWIEVSQEF